MTQSRSKAKGRRVSGLFVPFPFSVLDHENFINLSSKAKGLLMDLCSQLRFRKDGPANNGDLCATLNVLKARGWVSNESLDYALKELLHYGFILITRRGDRKRCHLYAITWWAINECGGKLDVKSTTKPLFDWEVKEKWKRPKRKKKN